MPTANLRRKSKEEEKGILQSRNRELQQQLEALKVSINHTREEFVMKAVDSAVVGGKFYQCYQVQCENVD